jgi:Ras-related protein Rab-5C
LFFITKRAKTSIGPANLNLWDTAGQERYRSLVPMYCRSAHVTIIVFDLSNYASSAALDKWYEQVKETAPSDCEIIIVGNKLYLPNAIGEGKVNQWVENQGVKYRPISAFSGDGIGALFDELVDNLSKAVTVAIIEKVRKELGGGCC